MKQRYSCFPHRLHHFWQQTLPAQSLCLVGSFSLVSSGLVLAQTESAIDNIVPTIENSQPTGGNTLKKETAEHAAVASQSSTQSEFSQRRVKFEQKFRKTEVSSPPTTVKLPTIETTLPAQAVVKKEKPPAEPTAPATTTARQVSSKPAATASWVTDKTKDYNNAYIDPTDYNPNAAANYEAPSTVVVIERSSGCRAVLARGIPSLSCTRKPVTSPLVAKAKKSTPAWLSASQNTRLTAVPAVQRLTNNTNSINNTRLTAVRVVSKLVTNGEWRSQTTAAVPAARHLSKTDYNPNRFLPSPSAFTPTTTVSSVPIAPSGGTLPAPVTTENTAPRPSTVAYNIPLATTLPRIAFAGVYGRSIAYNATGLAFPLTVPASITSLFGWRIHPITGDRRFHIGMDLAAAMGTPVLAAYSGQVETASWMGGYGLAVVLNHNNAQQTLYGHMSEIFVQPGQWVEKGTVIGRVGSTGNSTGPHLHFELRQLTPQGWVAVDPGVQLQSALSQLVHGLHTASIDREPGS